MSNMIKTQISSRTASLPKRILPSLVAFVATLLALPIQAVTIPAVPLQSGSAYPPANIMFILDDSGSMAWDFMPGAFGSNEVPATSPVNIALNAYPRNTLYYDPNNIYLPWMQSDGTRFTGGTSYTSAYSDVDELLSPTDLSTSTRTFYVPVPNATDLSQTASYYRYQILAGGTDVVRSAYGAVSQGVPGFPVVLSANSGGMGPAVSFTVPANINAITVTSSGGTKSGGNGADLYVQAGAAPTTGSYDCRSRNNNNNETCTINNPAAGTWYAALNRASTYSNVTVDVSFDARCGGGSGSNDWINCTSATPTGRSLANELKNYATWYSYSRTRIKLAKGGASEAFGQIGSNVRVGFDTIWNRNRFPIPVGTNNGQFSSTNRDTWYTRLRGAQASNGTPLKGALQRNGEYFKDTSASGPWGPATGVDQISCRQNFSILTTDGYWNDNTGYTAPVGDADSTGSTNTKPDGTTFTFNATKPYIDNFTTTPASRPDTLADVAMYYWKRDLVTTLANNVPTSTADPAFWQHMVTFSISIGQQGNLDPANDLSALTNGSKHWPDPTPTENASRIDDLWHAAVNGHGSFVAAKDPKQFAQGLVDALATVAARLGSASNVTANSTSFTSSTSVYQASYVSGQWTGELAAYAATQAGVSATAAWKASNVMPAFSGRNIITWSGTTGTAFPTGAQTAALARTSGLAPATGPENASYITGSSTLEKRNGGTLRDRPAPLGHAPLGDIAYSSPLYVKDSETIFVGANDGMLHAFSALTGVEQFAYIPTGINLADLSTLSDPQYTHKYFVDGPIAVSTLKQTPGKNYLVGSLGRGGKGVFGLDVTTPASFANGNVLWESSSTLTAGQNADMGQVLGEPLVVTLNDGTKGVLVSNGINSTNATASLFILNLATGAVIKELNTGVGSPGSNENGLFAPRGWDEDGNGTVDEVYAGDLKGNLWKFDLNGNSAGTWKVAIGGQPLFTTQSGQPITTGLALARDPTTSKRWVFIGTGSFLTSGDVANNTVQSMYGIIDDASDTAVALTDLTQRTIAVTGTVNGRAIRGFEPNATLSSTEKGWYINLDNPTAGERIISNPRVLGTVLLTASIIPPTTNTCDAGGTGYINALDAFSGTSLSQPFFDSNGDGKVDANDKITSGGGSVPVGSIDLGVGMPTLPTVIDKLLVVGGSKGSLGSILVNPQGGSKERVSWREILRD